MRDRPETKDQTQQQSRRDSDSKTGYPKRHSLRLGAPAQMAICLSSPTQSVAFKAPLDDSAPKRSLVLLPGSLEDFCRVCPPSQDLMSDHPTTALMQHPHLFEELFGVTIPLQLTFQKAPLLGRKLAIQEPADQYFQSIIHSAHFPAPHARSCRRLGLGSSAAPGPAGFAWWLSEHPIPRPSGRKSARPNGPR